MPDNASGRSQVPGWFTLSELCYVAEKHQQI